MADVTWWAERLDAWSADGLNVEDWRETLEREDGLASELLLSFEAMITRNSSLRRRVIDSTISHEEKGKWLRRLDEAPSTDSLIDKWEAEGRKRHPWEPFAHRAKTKWSERGKENKLSQLVSRLNRLDPSSISATQPLLVMIADPNSDEALSELIAEIELGESKRRKVIEEMVAMLESDGISATDALEMSITDALDHLTGLQVDADSRRTIRLRIEHDVRPFDDELAERLLDSDENNLAEQVDSIVKNFRTRLDSLNNSIDEWRNKGVTMPNSDRIRPEELLEWETNIHEVEKAVEIHLRALERWKDFDILWPDRTAGVSIVGHLEHTEEFVDFVDSLDHEWRELELDGMALIGGWEDRGFAMDMWRVRLADEPRSALAWLKGEEGRYRQAADLCNYLLALDTSLENEEEVLRRIAILREFDLDDHLLEEMDLWIDSKGRRTARHRAMLELEWSDIVRSGGALDVPTSSLSLAEFENLIASSRLSSRRMAVPVDRLGEKLKGEIDSWTANGFSTEFLLDLLEEDPMEVAIRISGIRDSVTGHERLRRRIAALDWTRGPEISVAIDIDLSRPDRLASLEDSIPILAAELASSEVQDEHFVYHPWKPSMKRHPVLVPASQTTVDDAMEAILEEMENSEAVPVEEEDEVAEEEIVEPVADVVEEVAPQLEETPLEITPVEAIDDQISKPQDDIKEVSENLGTLVKLLRSLGLDEEAISLDDDGIKVLGEVRRTLASNVGKEPRDMRIDRLLRLALRLIPTGDEYDSRRLSMIAELSELAEKLSNWTRIRLEARHKGGEGRLLEDSMLLGQALIRIPGPGTPIPLIADELPLPSSDDIRGLGEAVTRLSRRVALPASGGIN
jgi:hypothetical protein